MKKNMKNSYFWSITRRDNRAETTSSKVRIKPWSGAAQTNISATGDHPSNKASEEIKLSIPDLKDETDRARGHAVSILDGEEKTATTTTKERETKNSWADIIRKCQNESKVFFAVVRIFCRLYILCYDVNKLNLFFFCLISLILIIFVAFVKDSFFVFAFSVSIFQWGFFFLSVRCYKKHLRLLCFGVNKLIVIFFLFSLSHINHICRIYKDSSFLLCFFLYFVLCVCFSLCQAL